MTVEVPVDSCKRFPFGKNWKSFLLTLTKEKIELAKRSLQEMLEIDSLQSKRFLDLGSGSGLFSLAARQLGASVYSFDYDLESVACATELRRKYFSDDNDWIIEQGSALDRAYLASLGVFDVVYSWGVMHHTGDMWKGLENVISLVKQDGFLFISIYNDQGIKSVLWRKVKRLYCSNLTGKYLTCAIFFPYFFLKALIRSALGRRNIFLNRGRGMSIRHDLIDWLGGFPYEVAKPDEIFSFFYAKGFSLIKLTTTNSLGINQFVFQKIY